MAASSYQMQGKLIVVVILPEPIAPTALCCERNVLPSKHFRKAVASFIGIPLADLIYNSQSYISC